MSELDDFVQFIREQEHIDYQFVRLVETWVSIYRTCLLLEGESNESMGEAG